MSIVTCPGCGQSLQLPDLAPGQQVACPLCQKQFAPAGAAPPPTAPGTPMPYIAPPGTYSSYGYPPPPMQQRTSGFGIASLVLGISSIPTCFFYGIPSLVCGILAVVFAGRYRREVEAGLSSNSAEGQARAGRICGIVGIILSIALWVTLIAIIVFAVASDSHHSSPSFDD